MIFERPVLHQLYLGSNWRSRRKSIRQPPSPDGGKANQDQRPKADPRQPIPTVPAITSNMNSNWTDKSKPDPVNETKPEDPGNGSPTHPDDARLQTSLSNLVMRRICCGINPEKSRVAGRHGSARPDTPLINPSHHQSLIRCSMAVNASLAKLTGKVALSRKAPGCGKACNVVPQRKGIDDQVGPTLICCRNSFSSSNDGTASRVDLRREDRAGPAAALPNCPSVPQ